MGRDMPGQSGLNEIKAGDNGINRGKVRDLSPQLSFLGLARYWMRTGIIVCRSRAGLRQAGRMLLTQKGAQALVSAAIASAALALAVATRYK